MKKIGVILLVVFLTIGQPLQAAAEVSDYKSQLSKKEQEIYDNFYEYFYRLQRDDSYNILWNVVSYDKTSNELQQEYTETIQKIYSALVNDKPQYYWVKTMKIDIMGQDQTLGGMWNRGTVDSITVKTHSNTPHQTKDIRAFNRAVKRAVNKINKMIGKKKGKAKIVQAINQWICRNTSYDKKHGKSAQTKYEYLHNAYGVFIKKKAVCDGYAAAFKILCDEYGIPCMLNKGYTYTGSHAMEEHAWNLVRIKKKWYAVDTTWNDTNPKKKGKWILCGKKMMKKTHKEDSQRLDLAGKGFFDLPKLAKNGYM